MPPAATEAAPLTAAQQQLVVDHLDLVRRIAGGHPLRDRLTYDETVGAGNLGLVEAARSFDGSAGVPFGAFARRRITGAIIDAARVDDRLTRGARAFERRRMAAVDALLADGAAATDAAVAGRMGCDLAALRAHAPAQAMAQRPHSLSCGADGDGEAEMAVPVPDFADDLDGALLSEEVARWVFTVALRPTPEEIRAVQLADAGVAHAEIAARLGLLPRRVAGVVRSGRRKRRDMIVVIDFMNRVPGSLTAEKLGVTESRVSQLRTEMFHRLRARLEVAPSLEAAAA